MSRNQDGLRVATNVFEAALWKNSVRAACSCGQAACFQPHGLWNLCEKRGWSDEFRDLRPHLYCSRCWRERYRKVRPRTIEASDELPTIKLKMPDEREWKRALSRFRA
ncbi:hypothetical protein WG901_19575 [Novosphingobium sp. PS1R-30]|uniref:Uncharacterized protein n=1 Tax=Novosphingobium anseongense TaxID=3133436 RepID=A0ABU8S0T8_9SPHN